MSKKLIAVAAAAALALTGLVAAPAQASAFSVTVDGSAATAGSVTADAVQPHTSPIAGELIHNGTTTGTVVRYVVTTTAAALVEVSSAKGVKVLESLVDADNVALKLGAGTTGLSKNTTAGGTYAFFAYTTSTTYGTVTIKVGSNSNTYFLKNRAGGAYNLVDVKFPSSLVAGVIEGDSTDYITFRITDVFGNALTDAAGQAAITTFGVTAESVQYSETLKVYRSKLHSAAATGNSALVTLTAPDGDLSVNGFPKSNLTAFSNLSAASLAEQVKTLTAQVADLQAIVDRKVKKKRFNTLARKWNAAFPSQAVKLKK
jgi:hypothetical protein